MPVAICPSGIAVTQCVAFPTLETRTLAEQPGLLTSGPVHTAPLTRPWLLDT